MSKIRDHKWDKDDSILTLYYVKFGLNNLPIQDEKEFAEWVIGSSVGSLILQSANVRHVLGYNKSDFTLDCPSENQEWAVEKYDKMEKSELEKIVNRIIEKRDIQENIKIQKEKLKFKSEKETKRRHKEESLSSLEDAFHRMGKDPSKMKSLGRR